MQSTTKTLRDYQEKLVFNVCRTTDDVLVEQPTGSGKTVQIVTLVAMHLGKRFSHAVIAAPQEQIEQGLRQARLQRRRLSGAPRRRRPVHSSAEKGAARDHPAKVGFQ
jgi:superfamily II DNA or RNA helicase